MEPSSALTGGAAGLAAKMEADCSQGSFYDAQQKCKSLFSRMSLKKQYDNAWSTLQSGVSTMIKFNQAALALDVASLVFELFNKQSLLPNPQTLFRVLELSSLLSSHSSECCKFLESALIWHENSTKTSSATLSIDAKAEASDFSEQIHAQLATMYWKPLKLFAKSQLHFTRCSRPTENAQMLFEWASSAPAYERDLFLTRAVLQLLCLRKTQDAKQVQETFDALVSSSLSSSSSSSISSSSPLLNFNKFLLLAVERNNHALFALLRQQYKPYLEDWDPSFGNMLDTIQTDVFGVRKPMDFGSGGLGAMFGNVMNMLMGGGGADSASSNTGSTASSRPRPPVDDDLE